MEIRPNLSLVRTPSRDARVSCETLSQGVEDAFRKHEGHPRIYRSDTSEDGEKKEEEEEEEGEEQYYSFVDECYTPRHRHSYGHNSFVARSRHLLSCFHPKAAATAQLPSNNNNNINSPRRGGGGVVDSFMRWGSTRGPPPSSVPHSGPLNPNFHHGGVESTLPHSGPIMGPNNTTTTLHSPRRRGGVAESFMRWGSSRGPPPPSVPYSGPLNPNLHHGGSAGSSALPHSGPIMHHSTLPHSVPLMGPIMGHHSALPHSGPIMLNTGPIIGHSGPLKANISSKGHSSHFNIIPADIAGKKKPPGYDAEEPTSPEVTCIGRVRAKPKNQKPPRGNKEKNALTERRGLFATKKATATTMATATATTTTMVSLDSPRKDVGKPSKWRSFLHSNKDPKREEEAADVSLMESLGKWVDDNRVGASEKGEKNSIMVTSMESLEKGNGAKRGDCARVQGEINPTKVTSAQSLERANIGGKSGDAAREQGGQNPTIVTSMESLVQEGEINPTKVPLAGNPNEGEAGAAAPNPPENALVLMRGSSKRRDAMDYLGDQNPNPPLSNADDTNNPATQTPCDPNPNLENAALWKRRAFAGLSALDIQTRQRKLEHKKPFSS